VAGLKGSAAICRRSAGFESSVLVAVSGGKDSLVTLDLCVQTFERVEAFYMYVVPGIEVIEKPLLAFTRRLGVRTHLVPHWDLARLQKQAIFRMHSRTAADAPYLKQVDVERALRHETGIQWVAWGHRAADSIARRLMIRKTEGLDLRHRRIYPIWDWGVVDVLSYLRARRIPVPKRIGASGQRMSGFDLSREPVLWLYHNAPDDFARVKERFPFVEAWVMREKYAESRRTTPADQGAAV
jgi:phosphoadenosine phosphosulfate reductase